MIDLHCHVLPGIDDGPATIEGSLALARAAVAAGMHTLVATPHVSSRYPNDAATIAGHTDELAERLDEEGIPLELRTGAEISIGHLAEMDAAELGALGLGGGPYLLLEPPYTAVVTGVDAIVRELLDAGHRVVLAHPERCPGLHRDPEMLEGLIEDGVLTSITAASLVGGFGGEARRFALRMLELGLAHNVTSDAHDAVHRPPSLARELRAAGARELREWLALEVPAAILAGGELPPRPEVSLPATRPRWSWRRR